MKRRHITVPEPEYKRFASATADRPEFRDSARRSRNASSRQPPRSRLVAHPRRNSGLRSVRTEPYRERCPLRRKLRSRCVANFNHSHLPLPSIQPDWPCHVRLPVQSGHRSGTHRSGHRVCFRAGNGGIRFVRGTGRQPTRSGAWMRDVPGIRARSCRASGDATEHGRAARLRGGFTRTRSAVGRAMPPCVPARCSLRRGSRSVPGRLTRTLRPASVSRSGTGCSSGCPSSRSDRDSSRASPRGIPRLSESRRTTAA